MWGINNSILAVSKGLTHSLTLTDIKVHPREIKYYAKNAIIHNIIYGTH
jgi:hypothetical protein